MLKIGFKDFSDKQLVELLFGRVKLEKDQKLDAEFEGKVLKEENPITQVEQVKHLLAAVENIPSAYDSVKTNAFNLALIIAVIQNRKEEKITVFTQLLKRFNEGIALNVEEYPNNIISEISEETKALLLRLAPKIASITNSLINFLAVRLLIRLIKAETCTFIESRSFNHNFLNDIEKNFYEDRRLSKSISFYRNFFKRKANDKVEAEPTLSKEVYLGYSIDLEYGLFERTLLGSLSFEKKAIFNGALASENKPVANFSSSAKCGFDILSAKFKILNDLKQETRSVSTDFTPLFSLILIELERIRNELLHIKAEEKEAKIKNPKYNRKLSNSSELLLKYLVKIGSLDVVTEGKASDFTVKNEKITYESVPELFEVMGEVFAPLIETSGKARIPKGTVDSLPKQMAIKTNAISTIRRIYQKRGAVEIDTPIFELKDTLMGKYGEEGGKLIYDLEDQGGELLSLRYDLTVPFARFMGSNNMNKLKRFHIGKVYRRDQPNINKGRFREFYQCDLDIAGKTDLMIAEAELMQTMVEILTEFAFDKMEPKLNFSIKISHRILLEAIIECAGCELNKFKAICSSIDKLDKEPWKDVKEELMKEKGVSEEQCDKLEKIVNQKGRIPDLLKSLIESKTFGENEKAKKAIAELQVLSTYLDTFGIQDHLVLDLSLARGLDYYTGLIYEAVLIGESTLGSIASGGRYDELIGTFSNAAIPAVGMSIGLERIFTLLESSRKDIKESTAKIMVCSIGKGLVVEKLKLLNELWKADIGAEILHEDGPKPDKQLKHALEKELEYIIWLGENELKEGKLKVKSLTAKTEEDVPRDQVVEYFRKKLGRA